jgi:uncharacterized membrane protein YphA (DoxX/SURF4 family)
MMATLPREDVATVPVGPTCARSSLPPGVRLAIAFGVLFGLKLALPLLPLSASAQVVVLLLVASFFIWRFWWHCNPDRRGALLLAGMLWAAGALKLALQ